MGVIEVRRSKCPSLYTNAELKVMGVIEVRRGKCPSLYTGISV